MFVMLNARIFFKKNLIIYRKKKKKKIKLIFLEKTKYI